MIRVLLVASAARTRRVLESYLHARNCEVTGSFVSLEAASGISEDQIDVVLIEVGESGAGEVLESLEESGLAREKPVVALLEEMAPETASQLLGLGVRAMLPDDAKPAQVAIALEAAVHGLLVLAPEVAAAGSPRASPEELPEPLTPREKEVLRLLAAGFSNKEIAARLKISEHTAKFHVASILGKLGASSRTEAVSIGMRHGLILL